jgi:hypothetical protein
VLGNFQHLFVPHVFSISPTSLPSTILYMPHRLKFGMNGMRYSGVETMRVAHLEDLDGDGTVTAR